MIAILTCVGAIQSLTFGAILSATDPVAVAALLEEVGAPPRLKIHIAGEVRFCVGVCVRRKVGYWLLLEAASLRSEHGLVDV